MKKSMLYALAISGALLLISWGFKGHQAVATIAENHLTPEAKAAVKDLLGSQSLSDVAAWADEVRNEPAFRGTAGWHFANLPLGLNFAVFSSQVKAQGEDNVYSAIERMRQILTSAQSSRAQKLEALKFLVHFVGDAHQPMHISRKEDKGGNTIQVQFDGQGANLHALWDSKLIDHQGLSVTEMAKQYDQATAAQVAQWQADAPMQWLWESYQITERLYAEAEKNKKPGDDYYQANIGVISRRINQAGIRLAGVLNAIYSGKTLNTAGRVPVLPEEAPTAVPASADAKVVDVKEAAQHLNETVTVTAKVYGTKDFGSMVLVNVGAAYPDSPLTIVLRGEAKTLAVDGKTITVTGKVIDYKGKPEIVVTDKNQVSGL